MSKTSRHGGAERKMVRCAIYTRKSTEEGLEQEFNTLDAQRESAEAFIKSQGHEGWRCLPDRYDDGGFTGGNMDRPALLRLVADIEAGKIDCVVTYKVDRLSRSLLDFAKMMDLFDRKHVSFVSVTQQFNTTHSMGRLTLNILLSFAQFEREIISERTRDKIAAARKKGKWSGGMPVLGYDLDPERAKLIVNEREAEQVREIFRIYTESEGLIPTVDELNRRGWTLKRWRTQKGKERGGRPFDKTSLAVLLRNVVYVGKIRHHSQIFAGEQKAIVPLELWRRVQSTLKKRRPTSGGVLQVKTPSPLRGLLRCQACGCGMTPAHSSRGGAKRYRYYVCTQAQKRGWKTCPTKSIPALRMEEAVAEQTRRLADSEELTSLVNEGRHVMASRLEYLQAKMASLEEDDGASPLLGDAERNEKAEELRNEIARLQSMTVQEESIRRSLRERISLDATEQAILLRRVLASIECDGNAATLRWNPLGLATLASAYDMTEAKHDLDH
jgi:site-specific DNA recombinase